jgi:hypothetical protein
VTEAEWQRQVLELAGYYGWRSYHTYDSRRSTPGFPDLVLVRPPELLFVELKTDKGRLSAAQRDWLADLVDAGAEVYIWTPRGFDAVHDRLKRKDVDAAA